MADTAIKTGKFMIQDASDFYTWATEKSTFVNISFRFVADSEISQRVGADLRLIKGTMKLHPVASASDSAIWVRKTGCYCALCLSGERCNMWRKETTRKVKPRGAATKGAR